MDSMAGFQHHFFDMIQTCFVVVICVWPVFAVVILRLFQYDSDLGQNCDFDVGQSCDFFCLCFVVFFEHILKHISIIPKSYQNHMNVVPKLSQNRIKFIKAFEKSRKSRPGTV